MSLIRELIARIPYIPCVYTDMNPPAHYVFSQSKVLYVWTGASERTIYPEPVFNWRFRAHHDSLHRQFRLGFSFEEEKAVTQAGIRLLKLSGLLADVYWADNVGQQEYYYTHGHFPEDQRQFVTNYVGGITSWQ